MEEAVLVALIDAACNAIFRYVTDTALHDGVQAGEDTDVLFGTFVFGTGTYAYTDSDGRTTTQEADWSIHSSAYENLFIVDSEHVKWHLGVAGSSGTPQIGSGYNDYVSFLGGGRYVGVCTVDGKVTASVSDNFNEIRFTKSNYLIGYSYQSGRGYTSGNYTYPINLCGGTVTNYTPASNIYNNIIVLPADSTTVYSYNDMRQMMQTYITNNYPQFNITIPTWQDVQGETEPTEEETENGGCGCNIDYDEILSEGELESILNQETYELLPIETSDFTDIEIVETLPGQIQNLPVELVTTSNSVVDYGSQVVSELGLTPVYAPLLVFSLVCYILRGCA